MAIRIVHKLEAEPFAYWLSERAEVYGGVKALAEKVEQDHTWLGKLINGRFRTVDLDKADLILCKDGSTHLRELYPELYEEG